MLEVTRKAFLASLVPVVVNTILGEHQVVADIVAFVSQGDFPRSRLGEKQRGKVLATWVTRKLRTIAQFSIRDMDENPFAAEMPQHHVSRSSKPGSIMGNSTRRSMGNPENDGMPRSPAPVVLEEKIDVAPRNMPPELDSRPDNSVAATPVPAPTSAVPHIQEPQSATFVSVGDEHDHLGTTEPAPPSSAGQNRDFRFSFDIINTPIEGLPQDNAPRPTEQLSTGRDSLPSQQAGMHSGGPGGAAPVSDEKPRPGTQESGLIDDWPQEALMYQSALGAEEAQDMHNPNAAVHKRYDGSGYES